MPKKRKYTKIETETGDILEEGYDKIYTSKELSLIYSQKKRSIEKTNFMEYIESLGKYALLFYNHLNKLNIPNEIKTRFIFLTAFIKYDSNGLLVEDNKNQRPLQRSDLLELLNIGEKAFIRTINVLKENKLLFENDKMYYLNKKFVARGKLTPQKMSQDFTRVFADAIKELYNDCSPRQQSQLYYFYMILPLVNYKYNCVCHNPNETNLQHIKKMSIQEICISVGYNSTQWKRFWLMLRGFKMGKEYCISSTIIGDTYDDVLIKINPKIYYAGNENCFEELQQCCYEFFIGDKNGLHNES